MKDVPKYITSIRIETNGTEYISISVGFEKNGVMRLNFQDTARLDQDSRYIYEAAYPNSGIIASGKYELWLSMFTRNIKPSIDDE